MQQFTVPQFIDVESKIIGPITTRQFLIFLGAAILVAASYKLFDFSLFLVIAITVAAIAATFSFVKVNGRPFHFFILNITQTLRRPHLRVWDNRRTDISEIPEATVTTTEAAPAAKEYYKKSRLAEVALIVDTKGRYKGE